MDLVNASPVPSASAPGIASASSGGGGERSINAPRKTRSACNRCHAQKLKCVKKAGQSSSCERCLRLKTSCQFGPRVVRSSLKRPEPPAAEITLQDTNSMPGRTSVATRNSDTTITGVSEMEWLLSSDESGDAAGGYGQLALHFSKNSNLLKITSHYSRADKPLLFCARLR
jgi:hypothetical protein